MSTRRRGIGVFTALALASSGSIAMGVSPAAEAAPAVPNVGKLAKSLAKQKLDWQPCTADLQNADQEVMCATVKVPKDWHDVDVKDTWDVEISHLKNRDPSHSRYQGTIFMNPGGPGASGLFYPGIADQAMPDLMPYYNVLGFEPRGLASSQVSEVACTYTHAPDATEWEKIEAFGKTCSKNEDIKTLTTEQVAYDMDFIRHLLKLPKVDYIGYSYGTWLGAWYSKVFGAKYGGRFLLDSAVDVNQASLGHAWVWHQGIGRARQTEMQHKLWLERWNSGSGAEAMEDTQVGTTLTKAGKDAYDLPTQAAVADDLLRRKKAAPTSKRSAGTWAPKPAAVRSLLTQEQAKSATGAHKTVLQDQLRDLDRLSTLDRSPGASRSVDDEPVEVVDTAYINQIACNDGQWRQGKDYYEKGFAQLTPAQQGATVHAQYQRCAYWKTDTIMPDITDPESYPETIVVQSEHDGSTAWEIGRESGLTLPNTSFIAVDNESVHTLFPYGTEEVDGPIIDFFLTGERPKNITVAQGKPMYGDDVTYEAWTPIYKGAKHHGAPNTDPWRVAGGGVATPYPVEMTGAELTAPARAETDFHQWVSATYGSDGLAILAEDRG